MLNTKVYLTDVLGETVAEVYETYTSMTYLYDNDYRNAYSYGDTQAPQRVHQKQLQAVAERLGYSVDDVHEAFESSLQAITEYWGVPENFRDTERYES